MRAVEYVRLVTGVEDVDDTATSAGVAAVRFRSLSLTNYLSYRSAKLDFGNFTALVGPNGSGKSNAISALKLRVNWVPTCWREQ
jgi:ABC-type transport system involved in cytochrome bd biosynthesis fused ATPase/permease subunit